MKVPFLSRAAGGREAGFAEKLAYGCTGMATGFPLAFTTYYLLYFYTDVFLIPTGAIAALLFFYRVFDAADDLAIGFFMNRASFKRGKYRPYFLWLCAPFAVFTAAVFFTPGFGGAWKIVYAVLTLFLWESAYTMLNTAAGALLPYVAREESERTEFNSVKILLSIIAFLIVNTFGLAIVGFFSGQGLIRFGGLAGDRLGFFLTAAALGLVGVPLHFAAYRGVRERHSPFAAAAPPMLTSAPGPESESASARAPTPAPGPESALFAAAAPAPVSFLRILRGIAGNHRLLLLFGVYLTYWTGVTFRNQMTVFYVSRNLGRPAGDTSVVILVGLLATLVIQPVIPMLSRRFGRGRFMLFGLCGSMCSALLPLLFGASYPFLIITALPFGLCSAIPANLIFLTLADFVDAERKKNLNVSEIYFAAFGFCAKLGMGIAGGLCPLVL
ncbi:MAG: MFS transporter, partial [Clostridiales bacterium]|nr:MFS transporter [Clostridiales bacterium]